MAEQYELWLDESGDFLDESIKRYHNRKASLIGGILIESDNASRAVNEITIPTNLSHATELSDVDKQNHVLPILENLQHNYGARQVFFENALYEDGEDDNPSKSLYLRMMAEGILQLLMTLDARQDDIHLDVYIAKRSVEDSHSHINEISLDEYSQALKELIAEKKKNGRIVLSSNTVVDYKKGSARVDKKLQMADFASNTRLTRNSSAYSGENYQRRIQALHSDAYIFYLHEMNSANYIKQCLVENRMADAIMEILNTGDPIDIHKTMQMVTEKMGTVGYRILKSQMKDINACLIAYADKQDRYEEEEEFLKKIWNKIIPEFESCNIACEHLKFNILLILMEVYLREGDIISARKTLNELKKAQLNLGNCLEELFSLYQVKEKEALLYIKELDYQKAVQIMEEACQTFRHLLKYVSEDSNVKGRFDSAASEYYGDALCMQLHAMMFMQRSNPEIYEECCRLSDEAMKQYPKLPGELELHRKYRAHFEIEKGNCQSALVWLARAKEYELKDYSQASVEDFLRVVTETEEDEGAVNYLMYYLLILCEAQRQKDPLAVKLEKALFEGKKLLMATGVIDNRDASYINVTDINSVINTKDKREYHPKEIVYWKLGTCLLHEGKYDKALKYLLSADSLCDKSKDYSLMRIIGTVIKAELIYCLNRKAGSKDQLRMHIGSLKKTINELLEEEIQPATKEFIERIKDAYTEANLDGEVDLEKLLEISRLLAY